MGYTQRYRDQVSIQNKQKERTRVCFFAFLPACLSFRISVRTCKTIQLSVSVHVLVRVCRFCLSVSQSVSLSARLSVGCCCFFFLPPRKVWVDVHERGGEIARVDVPVLNDRGEISRVSFLRTLRHSTRYFCIFCVAARFGRSAEKETLKSVLL